MKPTTKIKRHKTVIEYEIDDRRASAEVHADSDNYFIFDMSVDETPFCCGMIELGQFSLDDFDDESKIIEEEKIIAVTKLVTRICQINKRRGLERAIIVNLIDDEACIMMEKVMLATERFKLIKEFRNVNTRNTVKTYITI